MFINILTKGGFRGAFRVCTCLKCSSLYKDTLIRFFFFVGALETSAPPTKHPLMDTKVSIL